MNRNASMWTGLYAPIAAFAFILFDHYDASLFGLRQCFFWACSYTFGVFAEPASESKIE